MRTCLSHSRQLSQQSAARTLPRDHYRQRHAEGWIGHYNRKSEANFKNKTQYKISKNFKHKCAPVCRIHISFSCNQQLAHIEATV